MSEVQQLLAEYVKGGSDAAFRELVTRYVDLVYSAALRLVNQDAHLAEDVTQTVFADLARLARTLSPDVMLGGWLHRHTCFVASKTMRGERRRQLREQQAFEMNSQHPDPEEDLSAVAPVLDEAINQLQSDDRRAILLRFFEQRDFRSVGEALGSTEEAARKRVDRALDKLHLLLKKRGVALSVAGLSAALTTQAVTAAPAGLAAGIVGTALAAAATNAGSVTLLQIMTMTKVQIGIATVAVAALAVPLVLQNRAATQLREENKTLQSRLMEVDQLVAENRRLSNLVARSTAASAPAGSDAPSKEVLRLRGEVGRLRQEQASDAVRPSPLSSLTSSPEMVKLIRTQQKTVMNSIYKEFGKRANLSPEQVEKLSDLQADHIMENIDHITGMLREGKTREEMDLVFKEQEAKLESNVQDLLGAEAYAQYKDYTQNLASFLTAEQFKGKLTGDDAAKDQKSKQLYQLMQQETLAVLASAGLPLDYQTVPTLNFRNIASEQDGNRSIKLLSDIYERVSARAPAFLAEEEVVKFTEFTTNAINANKMGLTVNRKMMAPGSTK